MIASAQARMILWTCFAVLAMSVVTWASTLTPPPHPQTTAQTPAAPASTLVALSDNARKPASVQPAYSAVALDEKAEHQAVDLTLPCEKESVFDDRVTQVRLTGGVCHKHDREIASAEIDNVSNGFQATVFQKDARTFTTDYITLAPGENRIVLKYHLANGEREEREFRIIRH